MRRNDIRKLFTTEYQVDPATGKEKAVNRYIGPWYTLEKKTRRVWGIRFALAWLAGLAAFIAAGVIPSWAGLCNYVVPWYILCMLPLFYLVLGIVKLMRLKDEFTQIDRSESVGYVQTSGLAQAVLGAAWSIATVIFLLLTNRAMTLPQELIFLGCGLINGAAGLLAYAGAKKIRIAEVPDNKKEAADEAACVDA